jgi:ABC-type branched-chain amino acid transport system, permease component
LEPPFPLRRDGWYMVALVALAVGIASFAWLVRGRFLRTLKLVRHDELAAQVMGVDVVRVKANVFTIGSAYSAVGGVLLAYYVAVLAPEAGGVNASLESLAMLVIGGSGSLFGPLLGAGAIQWLFAISGRADRYELLVYGLAFFCVVLYAPSGIAGALRAAWRRVTDSLVRKIPPKAVSTASAELKITDTGGAACRHLPAGRECREKFWRFARRSGREFRRQFRSDRCIDRTQRSGEIDPIQYHFRHRNSDTGTRRASG